MENNILDDDLAYNHNEEEEYWQQYIGGSADYYIPQWRKLKESGSQFSGFNIGALFFGVFWMLYRKMYRTALFFVGILIAIGVVEELLLVGTALEPLSNMTSIIIPVLLGFIGNWLYLQEAERKIADIKKNHSNYGIHDVLIQKGGTSIIIPFVVLGIFVLLVFLAISAMGLDGL